jgi:hypothetical protein
VRARNHEKVLLVAFYCRQNGQNRSMAWWLWALVGIAGWFASNLLLLGWFALLSLARREQASGAGPITFG